MFHVELRRFPHNFCRFNLSEAGLRALVLDAWAQGQAVEIGERWWSPGEATLTVLEGPELPVQDLAMGRGWRNAQRSCRDVTADLLASCSERPAGAADAAGPARADADALPAQLVVLLGDDAEPLLRAWQLALQRHPDKSPSECLALAEDLVRR